MSINKTKIIQELIDQNGYKSYLEIGLGNLVNFESLQVEYKVGVDPLHNSDSDSFFSENKASYDLIFIDGLHHADQVEKDVVNAWNCLNTKGQILIHDIKPPTFDSQVVPRKQKVWTGDVWRAWYGLQKTKLKLGYLNEDFGLGVIYKTKHKLEAGFVDYQAEWKEYHNKKGWLINI
jgi:hypothetical protein